MSTSAATTTTTIPTLFHILCLFSITLTRVPPFAAADGQQLLSELLSVPRTEFITSLQTTLQVVQQVNSIVSQFPPVGFGDFRVSNAINDCIDLLDVSTDHLTSTLAVDQNPKQKDNATGNVAFDMKTWLSATLSNQETCSEGFVGTNSIVKHLIDGGLNQVSSLVTNLLTMLKSNPIPSKSQHFPPWIPLKDMKLISQGPGGIQVNAIVANDGTGDFTSIMDAVRSVPDRGKSRYVIYIKKGVYKENVEIKKKKWNIFMFGDGMNNTIITGSKSFGGGYTTFRSATFGTDFSISNF